MTDTIKRQDAVKAIRDAMVAMPWPPQDGDRQIDDVLAAINALPAAECKQCSDLVHEINGYKDALAQAEGMIADLRARDDGPQTRWG